MKQIKIILLVTVGFLVMILGYNFTSDKKVVINLTPKNIFNENDVEIIEESNYVRIIPDLHEIVNVNWVKNDIIEFTGKKSNDKKNYYFSFNIPNQTLEPNINDDQRENVLKPFLDHLTKNSLNNDNIKYVLSKQQDKVAYYDSVENKIKIYNLKNKNVTEIDFEINNYIINNFQEALKFSYESGYILIATKNLNQINESSFSVYGSDSGKLYGDRIFGLNPVWANNSLSISFIYSEKNVVTYKTKDNGFKIAGGRLGIFNLKTRGIKYTEVIDGSKKIIEKPYWSDDDKDVYILIGKSDNGTYIPTRIFTYSIKNNILTDLNHDISQYIDSTLSGIVLHQVQNHLFITFDFDKIIGSVLSIDLNDGKTNLLENLQYFELNSGQEASKILFKYLDENYIYIKNNSIYQSNDNFSELKYHSETEISELYLSPNKDRILIIGSLGEDKVQISIIKVN